MLVPVLPGGFVQVPKSAPFNGGPITGKLIISGITNDTSLSIIGATHTGSDASPDLSIASTWNTSAAITAFKLNITNTASGAGSKLFDFQVGGSTFMNYDYSAGKLSVNATPSGGGACLSLFATAGFQTANFNLNAVNTLGLSTGLDTGSNISVNGDNANGQRLGYGGATTVAQLLVGNFCTYSFGLVTDALTPVVGQAPAGGGAKVCLVAYNSVAWVIVSILN